MGPIESRNTIHPTAVLEGLIQMGEGNYIGPHVVLQGNITLGNHNRVDAGVVIQNNVMIGNDCTFYPYASIGTLGEMGLKGDSLNEEAIVSIGNHVTVREFVCIHSPVYRMETKIEDFVYLMNKAYVAHDCRIGKGAVLSSGVLLAGRCIVGAHANLGLGATVHQRMHIGAYSMVGMQSVVIRDILPYSIVAGNPARILRFNRKGVENIGYTESYLNEMEEFFRRPKTPDPESQNPMMRDMAVFMEDHPECLLKTRV